MALVTYAGWLPSWQRLSVESGDERSLSETMNVEKSADRDRLGLSRLLAFGNQRVDSVREGCQFVAGTKDDGSMALSLNS